MFQPFWVHVKYRPLQCVTTEFFTKQNIRQNIFASLGTKWRKRKDIEEGIRICLQQQNIGTTSFLGDPICVVKHDDSMAWIRFSKIASFDTETKR